MWRAICDARWLRRPRAICDGRRVTSGEEKMRRTRLRTERHFVEVRVGIQQTRKLPSVDDRGQTERDHLC